MQFSEISGCVRLKFFSVVIRSSLMPSRSSLFNSKLVIWICTKPLRCKRNTFYANCPSTKLSCTCTRLWSLIMPYQLVLILSDKYVCVLSILPFTAPILWVDEAGWWNNSRFPAFWQHFHRWPLPRMLAPWLFIGDWEANQSGKTLPLYYYKHWGKYFGFGRWQNRIRIYVLHMFWFAKNRGLKLTNFHFC